MAEARHSTNQQRALNELRALAWAIGSARDVPASYSLTRRCYRTYRQVSTCPRLTSGPRLGMLVASCHSLPIPLPYTALACHPTNQDVPPVSHVPPNAHRTHPRIDVPASAQCTYTPCFAADACSRRQRNSYHNNYSQRVRACERTSEANCRMFRQLHLPTIPPHAPLPTPLRHCPNVSTPHHRAANSVHTVLSLWLDCCQRTATVTLLQVTAMLCLQFAKLSLQPPQFRKAG